MHPRDKGGPSADDFGDLVRTFAKVGCLSFGGAAAQIAWLHRIAVEEKGWLDEKSFLHALNFCMLLPGPEAQQLATYIGWQRHGLQGGLIAGGLFVVPGAVVMLGLSIAYVLSAGVGPIEAAFFGIKAAALMIVIEAVLRIGRRALIGRMAFLIAAAAFVGIFIFRLPFPLVIGTAALAGWAAYCFRPPPDRNAASEDPVPDDLSRRAVPMKEALAAGTGATVAWLLPPLAILALLGPEHLLTTLGLFFSKLAALSFGGAYAVLAWLTQEAVAVRSWLRPGEMLDGLGLAETTPGPTILVNQFVGFVAAYREPAPFSPLLGGTLGSVLVVWVTFAPSFVWIFLGGPFLERLRSARALNAALAAVTAAVVGVILDLALRFGLRVFFQEVGEIVIGPARLPLPEPGSLDFRAVMLGAIAAFLLFRLKFGVPATVGVMAGLGLLVRLPAL